jgi:hypothetical protein
MADTVTFKYRSPWSFSQRISSLEYLFVLVLIIYAGHAIRFVVSFSISENPLGSFIPILFSGILALKWRIVFNKQFYILIFSYLIYFAAISIKYNEIRPTFFLNYAFLFLIVYVAVKALKFNFFRIYETLLYYLAIIGLIMWGIQIMLGGDTLYYILDRIPSIDTFSYVTGGGLNAIVYSIQPTSASLLHDFPIPRNCGFAWEPGGFAVFLCMAIFINLYFFKDDKKSKIRFYILLAALLSTLSTTGYVIFIVIIFFNYINKELNIILLLLPVLITVLIFLFSLPFMRDKIVSLVDETRHIDVMVEASIGRELPIGPQRFTSFLIAFRDFRSNPILGLGGKDEERWTAQIGANVSAITGLGNLMANFGLVGFLFFVIMSFKTSVFFSEQFHYKWKGLLFFLILLISISYGIILYPLFMIFWMYSLFETRHLS